MSTNQDLPAPDGLAAPEVESMNVDPCFEKMVDVYWLLQENRDVSGPRAFPPFQTPESCGVVASVELPGLRKTISVDVEVIEQLEWHGVIRRTPIGEGFEIELQDI